MVATSGDRLVDGETETVIRDRLLPLATLVTPNIAEAERLTEQRHDEAARVRQPRR